MKILFLDIDGTVLSHTHGRIPSSAIQAINEIRKKGILVFGCTGRHTIELEKLPLQDLKVDGWITMNGAYSYLSNGTVISSYPISQQDIHILYDYLKKNPFPCQFLESDLMYMNMHSDVVADSLANIHSIQDPIATLERILDHDIYMFIPWVKEEVFSSIQQQMRDTACVRWNVYAVDCFHKKCGKNQGIQDVLSYYHFEKLDAACVGDGENDLAMFEACGVRVAMGNACQALKACADFVTDDIDADGLAKSIKYLVK